MFLSLFETTTKSSNLKEERQLFTKIINNAFENVNSSVWLYNLSQKQKDKFCFLQNEKGLRMYTNRGMSVPQQPFFLSDVPTNRSDSVD